MWKISSDLSQREYLLRRAMCHLSIGLGHMTHEKGDVSLKINIVLKDKAVLIVSFLKLCFVYKITFNL
jgi:hypothetical protein